MKNKGKVPYFKSIRLPVPRPGHAIKSDKDYDRRTGKAVPEVLDEGETNE